MKITLDSIVSGFKSVTKLISNFDKIEDDLNNKVLYRNNPEGEPNYMQNDLDMNSYNIINQGNPVEVSGFNWTGDWSSLTTYAVGDAVHSNGTAYIAIAASTNQTPPNGTYWQIVAEANYPTQTGNAGKALTTDGSAASWGSIHADHVDFTNSGTGGVERTLQAKLEDVVNVKDFGAVGDGATDDTAAIQAAVDIGSSVYFPDGTYLMGAVTINSDITIKGSGVNAVILRPTNFDGDDVSELTASLAHFDVTGGSNLKVSISNLLFDGNEANQAATVPRGYSIRFHGNTGATTGSSHLSISDCLFKDQTHYAISVNGGDVTNEIQTVSVKGCQFLDGRIGIGSGDPAASNPNGFAPFSIQVTDHIDATITDCKFMFRKALATNGEYAPSGVRFTFLAGTTNADGASGSISNCVFYRMGRKDDLYTGAVTGNNGLGCIDFYGRGREVTISNNKFDDCFNSGIRGKTNIDLVTVTGNILNNVPKAINIGPNTFANQVGKIVISGNAVNITEEYAIGVVGNVAMTPAYVQSISITGNVIQTVNNTNAAVGNVCGILVRYARSVSITGNSVLDASSGVSTSGIKCRGIQDAVITGNNVRDVSDVGIYCNGLDESVVVSGNSVKECGSYGISIDTTLVTTSVAITGNHVNTAVNYGVVVFTQVASYTVTGNIFESISGLARAVYVPPTVVGATVIGNVADATTGLFNANASGETNSSNNSWDRANTTTPTIAPATGTWAVGDISWDSTPSAGGTIGWVCVTAGTPGTWKTFGTISA